MVGRGGGFWVSGNPGYTHTLVVENGTGPQGGGHSPWLWFWIPTAKQTFGAVAVNTVSARKRWAVTDLKDFKIPIL